MKNDALKKMLAFFLLALSVLGLLGGIGYTLYFGQYAISLGIAALGYVGFDGIKNWVNIFK